jgi:hypothetical protein
MKRWNFWHFWISWISGIFGLASLIFAGWGFGLKFEISSSVKVSQAIILVTWILAPPIWFWYEYFFLYRPLIRHPDERFKMTFEEYKHGVDVSSKIWLALVTALLGLYFGKDLGR